MDKELEKLRKKKLQQLQREANLQDSIDEQERQQEEFEEQKKQILRTILTPAARERLGNIKVARPEIAEQIETQLIMLVQRGQLKKKINDKQFRELLSKLIPKKRDINIRRK